MLRTFFVDTDGWKAAILAQGRDAVAKATASISAG
jgi:hypothetical protein